MYCSVAISNIAWKYALHSDVRSLRSLPWKSKSKLTKVCRRMKSSYDAEDWRMRSRRFRSPSVMWSMPDRNMSSTKERQSIICSWMMCCFFRQKMMSYTYIQRMTCMKRNISCISWRRCCWDFLWGYPSQRFSTRTTFIPSVATWLHQARLHLPEHINRYLYRDIIINH